MKEYIEKDKPFFLLKNYLNKPNGQYNAQEVVYLVDDLISDIPAADVVEVRHGEWKKVHDEVCYWLACSVCGEEIPKRFGTDYYTNYCPNCGAKMDGGVNDGQTK